MKTLEKIAYHLYVKGVLSKTEIKNLIRDGYINYYGYYLYDPVEKELSSLAYLSGGGHHNWEYENWENDYAPKEKVVSEFLDLLESRTKNDNEIELNPGLNKKPKLVELPQLLKSVRSELDKSSLLFHRVFSIFIPSFKKWQEGAEKLINMHSDELFDSVNISLKGNNGNFRILWDFIEYSNYMMSDFSGPVMVAFRKILHGTQRKRLGQFDWIMEHNEFLDLYLIVQSQKAISRAMAKLILKEPDFFGEKLSNEYHSFAFSCGVLFYSASSYAKFGMKHLTNHEISAKWDELLDFIPPAAWSAVHFMDSLVASGFLKYFFNILHERESRLHVILMEVLIDYSKQFSRDMKKKIFVEEKKHKIMTHEFDWSKDKIFSLQVARLLSDNWWGQLYNEENISYAISTIKAWWSALEIDLKGYGAAWIIDEERWERRIVGYEPFINIRKFNKLISEFFNIFYLLKMPKSWESVQFHN